MWPDYKTNITVDDKQEDISEQQPSQKLISLNDFIISHIVSFVIMARYAYSQRFVCLFVSVFGFWLFLVVFGCFWRGCCCFGRPSPWDVSTSCRTCKFVVVVFAFYKVTRHLYTYAHALATNQNVYTRIGGTRSMLMTRLRRQCLLHWWYILQSGGTEGNRISIATKEINNARMFWFFLKWNLVWTFWQCLLY